MRTQMTLSLAALALCTPAAAAWADDSAKDQTDSVEATAVETDSRTTTAEGPLFIPGDETLPPLFILPNPGQTLEGFAAFFASQGHSDAAVDALRAASRAMDLPTFGIPLSNDVVQAIPPAQDRPGPWATFFPGAIFNLLARVPDSPGPAPVEGDVSGDDTPTDEVSPTEDAPTFIQRRRRVGGVAR